MNQWLWRDTSRDILSLTLLPTRLLHVNRDGRIRLVHVEHIARENTREQGVPEYVALSHRWGVSQHFTTTEATVDERCCGFSIDELPATFRDAVHVVTRLGFSYLWIDALCILQDNKEDWERESKKMGDVFSQARFTIAVHCSVDDSEGFLAKSMGKRSAVEFKYNRDIAFRICRRANFETDVTNSQLCKRGWVLQERFLALRTFHFTEGQLYFETSGEVQSEDDSLDLPPATNISSAGIDQPRFFSPSAAPYLRGLFSLGTCSSSQWTNYEVGAMQNERRIGSLLE